MYDFTTIKFKQMQGNYKFSKFLYKSFQEIRTTINSYAPKHCFNIVWNFVIIGFIDV